MLMFDDDVDIDPGTLDLPVDLADTGVTTDAPVDPLQLSSATAFGIDGPQTMKFLGNINGTKVVVMVDSGATHCFISPTTVASLGLPIDRSVVLPVTLGDGKNICTIGVCPRIELKLGTATFFLSAHVFPVSGLDIILGVTFLAALGEIQVNWNTQTLKFSHNNEQFCLHGALGLQRRQISAASALKLENVDSRWILWPAELNSIDASAPTPVAPDVQRLLDEFSQVLTPLPGLPPPRAADHRIPLKLVLNRFPSDHTVTVLPKRRK